jgi:hypothetical protein
VQPKFEQKNDPFCQETREARDAMAATATLVALESSKRVNHEITRKITCKIRCEMTCEIT